MVVRWIEIANADLSDAIAYIAEDSQQNAVRVKRDITAALEEAARHPLKYPPDKWKEKPTDSIRAFELYRYRISYSIESDAIVVIRFVHTSRRPLKY